MKFGSKLSWMMLAALATVRVWLVFADLKFTYGAWIPPRPEPFTFLLAFVFPLLWDLALCGGLWLFFGARTHGSGRLRWRWGVGALVAVPFAMGVINHVMEAVRQEPVFYLTTAHPWLSEILVVLAMAPIWVLSGPRVRA